VFVCLFFFFNFIIIISGLWLINDVECPRVVVVVVVVTVMVTGMS
jgi:hypothetical protein